MRVAIADAEPDVVDFLSSVVKELGHQAIDYSDGETLSHALSSTEFDLLILDWNLPCKNGLATLQEMNSTLPERPAVIVMTDRSAKRDIREALNAGADDYITKPEDRAVVAARISAMLGRNNGSGAFDAQAVYGKYQLNRIEQTVVVDGKMTTLTAKEFQLADMFFRQADLTLSRRYIMEKIWKTTADLATRTLDMHISRVRAKLELKPDNGFRISTVFGYGYRLETTN